MKNKLIKNICVVFIFMFSLSFFIESFATGYPVELEESKSDITDTKQVKRGAKAFAQYCMLCHAMKYMADDPIANQAGITLEKMPLKSQKWWFGTAPPDLSLIGRVHGADWLYTYLHSFYKDTTRPVGTNNLLSDNVNMPNPFVGVQGEQQLIVDKKVLFQDTPFYLKKPHYYTVLELTAAGTMTSDEFDHMVNDLVAFLVYAGEPHQMIRKKIGIWVMLFLVLLIVFIWLLKQSYWKNIKK